MSSFGLAEPGVAMRMYSSRYFAISIISGIAVRSLHHLQRYDLVIALRLAAEHKLREYEVVWFQRAKW